MIFTNRLKWTLCVALFCNIEYSNVARANAITDAMPTAISVATPVPMRLPVIDAHAQLFLRQMVAVYAKLNSFSCTVYSSGTPPIPKTQVLMAWKKPNRYSLLMTKGNEVSRVVSDGKTIYIRSSLKPREYKTRKLPQIDNLSQSIQTAGLEKIMLGNIIAFSESLAAMSSSEFQRKGLTSLRLEPTTTPDADVVVLESQYGDTETLYRLVLNRQTHLLRQVQEISNKSKAIVSRVETYTNVRINPSLTPAAFAFPVLKDDKVRVEVEPQYFDPRLKVGAQPLAFTAKDLDGNAISPTKYRGRVLLLDFWATWCEPCVDELPVIKAAYNKYHAQGFDIVGISLDDDKKQLTDVLREHEITWPQVFDGKGWESAMRKIYGVRGIPFTILIGRDGKIAALNLRGQSLEVAVKAALSKM